MVWRGSQVHDFRGCGAVGHDCLSLDLCQIEDFVTVDAWWRVDLKGRGVTRLFKILAQPR